MARHTGRSRTALSEAAGGDHLPTWETTAAFVKACGGDIDTWLLKWERVQDQLTHNGLRSRSELGLVTEQQDTGELTPPHPLSPVVQRTDRPDSQADILLRLWQEQRTQARQSENHRAIMTLVVVTGTVSGMAFVALQSNSRIASAAVALGVCLLGLFGALISAKYFERFKMHMDGAQLLRRRLNDLHPELYLEDDWAANRLQHESNYRILARIRLEHLWVTTHLGIALLGGTVAIVELAS
jgi:hypothetical protein